METDQRGLKFVIFIGDPMVKHILRLFDVRSIALICMV